MSRISGPAGFPHSWAAMDSPSGAVTVKALIACLPVAVSNCRGAHHATPPWPEHPLTHRVRTTLAVILAFLATAAILDSQPFAVAQPRPVAGQVQPVVAPHGMVVAQEKRAARIGAEILARGGNAVDAAVAVGFALAVTHPQAGNLGGGGFMLIHRADRNETAAIDYRETAPQAVTRDIFLDGKGRGRSAQVARFRACRRRARHGRGPCARPCALRLGQVHPRRPDRAGARARAQRHRGRGRSRRFASARAGKTCALAVVGEDLSQYRRRRAHAGTGSGAGRPCRLARRDRARRAARVLPRGRWAKRSSRASAPRAA